LVRRCAALPLLVAGILLSASSTSAGATIPVPAFQLGTNPTCPIGNSNALNLVGHACVDESDLQGGTAAWSSITDGFAAWNYPGGQGSPQWSTSYEWQVPTSIPTTGANMDVTVAGQEKTGNPNASICPAMAVGQDFTATPGGPYEVCAQSSNEEGVPGPKASEPKTISVVPNAQSGTLILWVGIQDCCNFYYQYSFSTPAPPSPPSPTKPQTTISYTLIGHYHGPRESDLYSSVTLRGRGSFSLAGSSKVSDAAGSDNQGKLLIELQGKKGSATVRLKPVGSHYIRDVNPDSTITYTIRYVYEVVSSPLACLPVGTRQVIVGQHHKGMHVLKFGFCGIGPNSYTSRNQVVSLKQSTS